MPLEAECGERVGWYLKMCPEELRGDLYPMYRESDVRESGDAAGILRIVMYVARVICCVQVSWLKVAYAIGLRERCDGRGEISPQQRGVPSSMHRNQVGGC
jgi:hypothetical protein